MRLLQCHPDGFDPARPWIQEGEEVRQDSRIFRQVLSRRRSPHTGLEHVFHRLQGADWVNVVAFTPAGDLLVVEQFRHGINAPTLEIPGGACDPGEEPLVSARRELREETGHAAGRWVSLGSCTPNPATQDNRCHSFLALECVPEAALDLDPAEELQLWACSWKEWQAHLRQGDIHHALVLSAFMLLQLWDGWPELQRSLEG